MLSVFRMFVASSSSFHRHRCRRLSLFHIFIRWPFFVLYKHFHFTDNLNWVFYSIPSVSVSLGHTLSRSLPLLWMQQSSSSSAVIFRSMYFGPFLYFLWLLLQTLNAPKTNESTEQTTIEHFVLAKANNDDEEEAATSAISTASPTDTIIST